MSKCLAKASGRNPCSVPRTCLCRAAVQSRMISSPVVRPKIHPSMAGQVTVQDQPRCRLLGPAAAAAAAEPSCGLGDFRRGVDARKPLRVRLFHAAGEGRSRRQEYSWQGFSERCSPACREHDPHRARGTVMGGIRVGDELFVPATRVLVRFASSSW
ncbi:hypothetical protein DFJ73DRAFT_904745 [Zopfochytrium polystomum]|nr:hypothetical protein DFJ73DRAFT_904745 [Zopfochytrium polystomum]